MAGIALLMALGSQPASAAIINVGGSCSLARAIVSANNDSSPQGFCRPGRGADTINLPANAVFGFFQANNTNYGPAAIPTMRTPITIVGNGSRIQRVKTAPRFHIFSVAKTGKLTLQKTTVSGGIGGLRNNGGILNLNNSTVSGNTGCGIDNAYVNDQYNSGAANVNNSIISGNTGCGISTTYNNCRIPDDYISVSRLPLFSAREVLRGLVEDLKTCCPGELPA
ncbi:MAG: hypothetical protein H0V34_10100 [Gammaproteobacteria bacterium]|nr:hypothetical protein [Gammaproteobacteria bacterium]